MLRARRKTFARNFFEIRIGGVALGNLEFRKRIVDALNFHIATSGDRDGAIERVGQFAKHLSHLFGSLKIKLVGRKFHPLGIAHRLAGLNAHQDFLRMRVRARQIVAIVRGNERNAAFVRKPDEIAVDAMFGLQALVLNFQKEIALAENIAKAMRVGAGLFVFFGE